MPLLQSTIVCCSCFSCNTTLKIAYFCCFLQYKLIGVIIAIDSIYKFGWCVVGNHHHTLANVPCSCLLPHDRTYACSLAIQCRNCSPCCLLIAIQHKKTCSSLSSLLAIISAHMAMAASCSHPCDTMKNMLSMLSLLAIHYKKYAFTSNGVKTLSSHESKATSQQLCVWRAFLTSFLQGKNSKTVLVAGKIEGI